MNQSTPVMGRGRGGNPSSRRNLKPQRADRYVVKFDAATAKWLCVAGPCTLGAARKIVGMSQTMSWADRSLAVQHDPAGVAALEAAKAVHK